MQPVRKAPRNIGEYINGFPRDVQRMLRKLRTAIKLAAPGAKEEISYRMPTFTLHGNLVYFAARKHHIGFYPTPFAIRAFKMELSPYEVSKGTMKFPLDRPLPLTLVSRIVKFRVKENLAKRSRNLLTRVVRFPKLPTANLNLYFSGSFGSGGTFTAPA